MLYLVKSNPDLKVKREWKQRGQRAGVFFQIQQSRCPEGETHLRGTKRRRWSGDSEPGTAEAPPSAPEPQSNPQQFPHRRSSWRISGSTWGKKTEGISFSSHFLFFFPHCVCVLKRQGAMLLGLIYLCTVYTVCKRFWFCALQSVMGANVRVFLCPMCVVWVTECLPVFLSCCTLTSCVCVWIFYEWPW